MTNCIPNELFNMIPLPQWDADRSLDAFIRESAYRLPSIGDVVVLKELWHTACDIAERLGALLEFQTADGNEIEITPAHGRFLRLVGADTVLDGILSVTPSKVTFRTSDNHRIVYSVVPDFGDQTTGAGGKWDPQLPAWFLNKYSKLLYDGMMMRVYALKGEAGEAKMMANAYANGLVAASNGLITSGMKKNIRVDVETYLVQASASQLAGARTAANG